MSLYNNALMLLARALRVEDVQAMFVQYNQVIERMLSLAEDRSAIERERTPSDRGRANCVTPSAQSADLDPYVSCFVAMPFRDDAGQRHLPMRSAPLPRTVPTSGEWCAPTTLVEQPGSWANLKTKLLRAHCYIAILTGEVNPNVMIEIGRMEAIGLPLLLLRDTAAGALPADLNGLLYEELRATGSDLVSEVRDALARQDRLRGLRGSAFPQRERAQSAMPSSTAK